MWPLFKQRAHFKKGLTYGSIVLHQLAILTSFPNKFQFDIGSYISGDPDGIVDNNVTQVFHCKSKYIPCNCIHNVYYF